MKTDKRESFQTYVLDQLACFRGAEVLEDAEVLVAWSRRALAAAKAARSSPSKRSARK